MNGQAKPISSDLRPVHEQELTRVVLMRVESMGRRSVHPADRIAAAHLAAEVVRAIQGPTTSSSRGLPLTSGRRTTRAINSL
jgi:hypothetical protein